MENILDDLAEILKPYHDKREQIKLNSNDSEVTATKIRLENLRNKKAEEIENYIKEYVNPQSSFYSGYEHMIRRDLEQAYINQEKKLENEIKILESKPTLELIDIKRGICKKLSSKKDLLESELKNAQTNFDQIMLELSEFKYEYNEDHVPLNGRDFKRLFDKSEEFESDIKVINDRLVTINNVLSSLDITEEEKLLMEEIKSLIDSMDYYGKKQYEDILNLINPKEEEVKAEQNNSLIEYKSAEKSIQLFDPEPKKANDFFSLKEKFAEKNLNNNIESKGETMSQLVEPPVIDDDNFSNLLEEENSQPTSNDYESSEDVNDGQQSDDLNDISNDIIDSDDPVPLDYNFENSQVIVETFNDLLGMVWNDLVESTEKLESVRLSGSKGKYGADQRYFGVKNSNDVPYEEVSIVNIEGMNIPDGVEINGEYYNEDDVCNALRNFRSNKGEQKYYVKEINKTYTIPEKNLSKFKSIIKDCSAIELLRENALQESDLLKVFAKEKIKKLSDKASSLRKQIGTIKDYKSKVSEGLYVARNEIILNFARLFEEQSPKWLKTFKDKIRNLGDRQQIDDQEDKKENKMHM